MSSKSSISREEEELRAQLDALLADVPKEAEEAAEAPQPEPAGLEGAAEAQEAEGPAPETAEPEEPTAEAPESDEAKSRRRMNFLYDFIMIAGVCMLIGGGVYIAHKYIVEKKSSELYSSLEDQFVTAYSTEMADATQLLLSNWVWSSAAESADGGTSGTIWYRKVKVDLKGLQEISSDVAGWLFFENEQISYPVMFSGDNSYLYADMYGNYSTPGSLFLQGDNTPDFEDSLSIIYGHNMRNGTMFGKLKQYREDEDYYQDHQYFQIFVGDKVYRYRVFAYFRIGETEVDMVNVKFTDQVDEELLYSTYLEKLEAWEAEQAEKQAAKEKAREEAEAALLAEAEEAKERYGIPVDVYLRNHPLEEEEEEEEEEPDWMSGTYIKTDYTFQEYLDLISERSMIDSGIEVTEEDKIVMLFTCSVHGDGKRFIVYGVRVDEHDFSAVDDEAEEVEFLDR